MALDLAGVQPEITALDCWCTQGEASSPKDDAVLKEAPKKLCGHGCRPPAQRSVPANLRVLGNGLWHGSPRDHPDFWWRTTEKDWCSSRGSSPIWKPSVRPPRPALFEMPNGWPRTAPLARC